MAPSSSSPGTPFFLIMAPSSVSWRGQAPPLFRTPYRPATRIGCDRSPLDARLPKKHRQYTERPSPVNKKSAPRRSAWRRISRDDGAPSGGAKARSKPERAPEGGPRAVRAAGAWSRRERGSASRAARERDSTPAREGDRSRARERGRGGGGTGTRVHGMVWRG